MSWLPKRDKLDPVQASAIDFAVAQEGNFSIKGEAGAGKSVVLAHVAAKFKQATSKVSCCECQSWSDLFCQTPTTYCNMS